MGKPLTLSTVIVGAGQSLSDALDCTTAAPVFLGCPADWTAANLTFQVSADGILFHDVFDVHGNEIMMPVRPGCLIFLGGDWSSAAAYLRLRSGTRERPVPQTVQRDFTFSMQANPAT